MLKWKPELYGRSLLRLADLSDEERLDVIDLSVALKARPGGAFSVAHSALQRPFRQADGPSAQNGSSF